jgi:hypothetical protein
LHQPQRGAVPSRGRRYRGGITHTQPGRKVSESLLKENDFTKDVTFVRFEVFSAVAMKNAVFWNIKTQFIPHRRHIMSLLQGPAS